MFKSVFEATTVAVFGGPFQLPMVVSNGHNVGQNVSRI